MGVIDNMKRSSIGVEQDKHISKGILPNIWHATITKINNTKNFKQKNSKHTLGSLNVKATKLKVKSKINK